MPSPLLAGEPFIELAQVQSTNNYATGLVHAGMAQSGTAVFAHHQSAGKGQRNKGWQSEAGQNIALSVILLELPLSLSQSFLLSMASAVAAHGFIKNYVGDEVSIKWPNDIYWRDRKTAGILVENIIQGSLWKAAVAGIGININQSDFGELNRKAVSLRQITGKQFDPVQLARELCTYLTQAYTLLTQQPSQLIADYHSNLYKLNLPVRLKQGSRVFEAVVKNVTPLGELIVQHATEEHFAVGEVEWMLT